jgi:hypothetical protein
MTNALENITINYTLFESHLYKCKAIIVFKVFHFCAFVNNSHNEINKSTDVKIMCV